MALAHNLGFPRCAYDREQRVAVWQLQREAGIDLLPVGDCSAGDQVLAQSLGMGLVAATAAEVAARAAPVVELARWFDGERYYAVPQFDREQRFQLDWEALFAEVDEAQALGYRVKPVLLGPLSFLWLGRSADAGFDRLELLEPLLAAYGELFQRLAGQGVEWVQLDEPILALNLPQVWKNAFERAYNLIQREPLKKLVAACFGGLQDNLGVAVGLPVDGLHVDLAGAPEQCQALLDRLPGYKLLSLGIVDGRSARDVDLQQALEVLRHAHERLGERLWVAPSCSLAELALAIPHDQDEVSCALRKCRQVGQLARTLAAEAPAGATARAA